MKKYPKNAQASLSVETLNRVLISNLYTHETTQMIVYYFCIVFVGEEGFRTSYVATEAMPATRAPATVTTEAETVGYRPGPVVT